jgi:cytochrome P450
VHELDDGDDYLTATLYEVMRRRPVLPTPFPRWVKKPFTLGEYTFEPGVALAPSAYLLHHEPAIYRDPSAFRPERFLDEKPGTYTWIGFGGGRRRCLGGSFAMLEMKTVLRSVLESFEVRPTADRLEPPLRDGARINPQRGARVVLASRARRPAVAAA